MQAQPPKPLQGDLRSQVATFFRESPWGAPVAFVATVLIALGVLGIFGVICTLFDKPAYSAPSVQNRPVYDAYADAQFQFKARNWLKTIEACDVIIGEAYHRPEIHDWAYFHRGFANLELHRDRNAELDYQDLTQRNPRYGSYAWHNLGLAQERLGRPDYMALASFQKAVEMNPQEQSSVNSLANVRARMDRQAKAEAAWKQSEAEQEARRKHYSQMYRVPN